jgi:hypothetical protein
MQHTADTEMAAAPAPAAAAISGAPAAATVAPGTPLVHIYTQSLKALLPAGTHPCAGALPTAQRLAAPNLDTAFVATGNQLSLLQPRAPANPVIKPGRQGPFASDFIPLQSRLTTLKEHAARSELQCVAARSLGPELERREYLVASIDSYGGATLSRVHVPQSGVDGFEEDGADAKGDSVVRVLSSSELHPPARVEDGWHGISLHPDLAARSCVASHFAKSLSLYDEGQLLQTLYTSASPTAIRWFDSVHFREPLLACTEGNALSIWDVRMRNGVGQMDNISRGPVQRLQDAPGQLLALDTHNSGLVAIGGVDKQVTVYGQ